jgi:uncharacterized protein
MQNVIRLLRFVAVLCAISLLASPMLAERVEQLKPTNYLNDFAGVIDAATAARINALCQEVEQKTKAQIAVVTIRTLEGAEASDFANRLFKQWGVGDKERDRGVLVLLAVDDHKYWTEVGYGLEPILPDGKVGGFGREMVPLLRQQRVGDAVELMTTRIAQTIADDAGVQLTGIPAQRRSTSRRDENEIPWQLILFILFVVFPALGLFGRRSGCSGCLWPLLFSTMGGGRSGWGGSSDWGGGFGGGGGGGGFGGFGGGSSGGGGAGGSW